MRRYNNRFLIIPALLCCLFFILPLNVQAAERLQNPGEKIVIVIDPGHGGDNRGTIENNHEEKGMTMITAQAMYDELCLYDNVEVHLTRTEDEKLEIDKRAAFAKEKDADFLFSIHYNASESHALFGSEVWVSAFAPYNAYGYQFGCEFLSDMRERGLLVRGVKTRLGDKGTDYYGIIREAVALDIPAAIIEHCHVDEPHDEGYCDSTEKLQEFGRADATAVARYFGLKSSILQVDYSDYQLADANASAVQPVTVNDDTEPDICQIDFLDADYENGILKLTVNAADYDSTLLYYDYSLDGGATYSDREIWEGSDALTGNYPDTLTISLKIPDGVTPSVIVRAYNMYDLYRESNCYQSRQPFGAKQASEEEQSAPDTAVEAPESAHSEDSVSSTEEAVQPVLSDETEQEKEVSLLTFLEICLVIVVLLFALLLVSQTIAYRKRRRRRYQRRNDEGTRRNQPR